LGGKGAEGAPKNCPRLNQDNTNWEKKNIAPPRRSPGAPLGRYLKRNNKIGNSGRTQI